MSERIHRARIDALGTALDIMAGREADAADACVLQTFAEDAYPEEHSAYYACRSVVISGDVEEGATPALSPIGDVIYAYNLGGAVPDPGTYVIGHHAGGRWVFRWDA